MIAIALENVPWFTEFQNDQASTIERILDYYEQDNELVILDAPTGTGKTLIGEAVRQRLEKKGLYLCSSITLQHQFGKDFPYAEILMGRSNYLPTRRVTQFGRALTCADCEYDQTKKECRLCHSYENCTYNLAKQKALRTKDVANLNTSYFLTEANGPAKFSCAFPFAVLDEADAIEQELMRFVEIHISQQMKDYLKLWAPKHKTVEDSWIEWINEVVPYVEARLKKEAQDFEKFSPERQKIWKNAANLLTRMKRMHLRPEGWVYTGYTQGLIQFRPVMVDQMAHEYLWDHVGKWLCMSATILSPDEFVDSMGYEGSWEVVEMRSPFPVKHRPMYYAPIANVIGADDQKREAWGDLTLGLKRIMARHPDERILVHTVSYGLSNWLRSELVDAGLGDRVVCYMEASERKDAIEKFESLDNGVLIASSLDRGYDGKDDLVRVVVVCKMPYLSLGDKQVNTRLFKTRGGGVWYAVQTARRLVQMVGRGMRHADDKCVTYILDMQFSRFWKEWTVQNTRIAGTMHSKHKLLPDWFAEAIVWGGPVNTEIKTGRRNSSA